MSRPDPDFWRGKRVLLTGHTGFKGGWTACWLQKLGAKVSGLALEPETTPDLHSTMRLTYESETIADMRIAETVKDVVREVSPQIVLHMAAQPLVRRSYKDPAGTIATNVMGTTNLLTALLETQMLKAILVITSDKAYDNASYTNGEKQKPFTESHPLGGRDPYSASKGAQEIIARSFAESFFSKRGVPVATARAGNVIGGGDWSEDRLLADVVRAIAAGETIHVRNPRATRPWQHVLEPVAGYLMFAQALVAGQFEERALNFGPLHSHTVAQVVDIACTSWPGAKPWKHDANTGPAEAAALELDSSRAAATLGWRPRLDLEQSVSLTTQWHQEFVRGADMLALTQKQIASYEAILAST